MEKDKKDIEKNELRILLEKGISFEIERVCYVRAKGLKGLIGKKIKSLKKERFTINEPTLSVLDRISYEQIELGIDEKTLMSETMLSEAKKLTKEHCHRMARIVAISVLGNDYIIATNKGEKTCYKYDDKKLDELTELFFHSVKPSLLIQYVVLINTMCNYWDFTNSIRLMSANRTTMPILVEQED